MLGSEKKLTGLSGFPSTDRLFERALIVGVCLVQFCGRATETWQQALSGMPLGAPITRLERTNCIAVMLGAFASNDAVKALIFMPGATDEFYMFRRASAVITNATPSLLDAITALTNQTLVQVTYRAPFLLLHTDEDPLEPLISIEHTGTVERLKKTPFLPHAVYNDRDWDSLQPTLRKRLKLEVRPWRYSNDSWHFYRHSFAEWGLNGWEALQALAMAGKSKFAVRRNQVDFVPDGRVRVLPRVQWYPK